MASTARRSGAVWADVMLRLGYLVAMAALLVVILTFGGSTWQQAGGYGVAATLLPSPGPYQNTGGRPAPPVEPGIPEIPRPLGGQEKGTPDAAEQLYLSPPEKEGGETTPPPGGQQAGEEGDRGGSQPLRQVPGAGRRVALTFDDGPFPGWTERYLTALAASKTKATFFVVGRQSETYPELVKAVLAAGHEVASHSWRHANLGQASRTEAEADLDRAAKILEAISGRPVKYFRPPYGAIGPGLLAAAAALGTRTVTWSIDPRDWSNPGPGAIVRHVLAHVREGSIILLHEGHPGTLAALPLLIKELRDKGYEPVTLSELIAGSENNEESNGSTTVPETPDLSGPPFTTAAV
ncbi:MAG: polysaccharide deacetylase family protein, partial [Moorella sp. (in: Bacteria)]|nr:polysaccharide deacetylase family protein [Moorella sp. (in: firmicutes)]